MQRLLADAQKLTGVKYDISNLSDVYQAIHAIQTNLGITGTTAKEASQTFTGSFNAMKAAAQNVLGNLALGEKVGPSLKTLFDTTQTFFVGNFVPMVKNIVGSIPEVVSSTFTELGPKIGQSLNDMLANFGVELDFSGLKSLTDSILPALHSGISRFKEIVGPAVSQVVTSFSGLWNAAQPLISIISEALQPAFEIMGSYLGGVFKGVLLGVSGLFDILKAVIEFITPAVRYLVDGFKQFTPVFSKIADWIGTMVGMFTGLGGAAQSLSGGLQGAWSNIKNAVGVAKDFISNAISLIKSLFSSLGSSGSALQGVMGSIWGGIKSVISGAGSVIQSIISAVKSAFSSFGSLVSSVGSGINTTINSISSTLRSLGSINLYGAGSAIMNGFLSGLKSAWGSIKSFVSGIAGWIRRNKGPISYDKRLLIPAGKAIMDGLDKGLRDNFEFVKTTVSGMAGSISDLMTIDSNALNPTAQVEYQLKDTSKLKASQYQNSDQSIISELIKLKTTTETLLGRLVDKDTNVYLDGDVVALNSYRRQGNYLRREGI